MIDYLPLKRITAMHGEEIREAVCRVVDGGWYLQGEEVKAFEQKYAHFIGTRHCIGVANGLDALTLILRAYIEMGRLKKGDEVLVPANTYIASILAITENGLTPVLVEPSWETLEIDDNLIEQHISPRTRALMLVHLYGRCAYTERIGELCRQHNLLLIEDNAQAHGCHCPLPIQYAATLPQHQPPRLTGSLGHAAGHSFYPGKNLGALGDGGAVTTDDDELAAMVRTLANYGSSRKYVFPYQGRNSRLDEIQAAVLSVKLKYLEEDNRRRQEIATYYINNVKNPLLHIPQDNGRDNVYHIFTIFTKERERLQQHLAQRGIQAMIHYPIPPHRQDCYRDLLCHLSLPVTERIHKEELSIPCHQAMTDAEIDSVVEALNK